MIFPHMNIFKIIRLNNSYMLIIKGMRILFIMRNPKFSAVKIGNNFY